MTMKRLREILAEQIDEIRKGTSTPRQVNAVVNAAGKFLFSVKLELDYIKLKGGKPKLLALEE